MKLILDSNILISALIKDSKTREIILESDFEFSHPEMAVKNLEKYRNTILEKSGLSESEYEEVHKEIINRISLVEKERFLGKLEEAKEIMEKIDIEDVVFIALALSIENDGIWSDDIHFQRQNEIKIYKTKEIIKIIEDNGEII